MKKLAVALAVFAFTAFAVGSAWASDWLNGPHTNLNIIGGPSCGSVPSGTSGGRIFVPLTTIGDSPKTPESMESTTFDATDTSIFLIQGPTFKVCNADACSAAVDCNGTPLGGARTTGAVFELPCDVLTASGTQTNTCTQGSVNSATYCIYAAAAGKPGGNADITTCGVDASNNVVCSTGGNAVFMRDKKGPVVQDVTAALTTLTCTQGVTPNCPCPTGTTCTFEIFNSAFQFFLWDYDNAGLKNAKLRFYPQPAGTTTCPIP